MNWKSTLALVILAGAAAAWWWKGDEWAVRMGFRQPAAAGNSPSLAALAEHLAPGNLTLIEIPAPSGDPFVLEKADNEVGWRLPGNWPLRKPEVDELVATLTDLRPSFQPIPLAADTDLTQFGLAHTQKPVVVTITANGKDFTLTFGEPKPDPNEPPFTRPAFLRVNNFPEVFRLGPDVLPILRRPADAYRKRQLFPDAERVKVMSPAAGPASPFGPPPGPPAPVTVTLPDDKITAIDVRGPDASFTLRKTGPTPRPTATEKGADPALNPDRLADAWEIASPARDRLDPAKLQ